MPTAPLISGVRRFWIIVALFALANVAGWLALTWRASHRPVGLLVVDSFDPGARSRPRPTWRFNIPVDAGRKGVPGTISPSLAGTWRWDDPRTLSFVPEAPLPKGSKFTIKLNAEWLRSVDGHRLAQADVRTFTGEALRLTEAPHQSGFDEKDQFFLTFRFNDRVSPKDLLKHLTVKTQQGDLLPVRLDKAEPAEEVTVIVGPVVRPKEYREIRNVELRVAAAMTGLGGPIGLEGDAVFFANFAPELALMGVSASSPGSQDPSIHLNFNGSVDSEVLNSVLSIEPKVEYEIAYASKGDVKLQGGFQFGQRYLVKIAEPPPGASATKYPRADARGVFIPDRDPGVWFEHRQGYLGSRGNRTVLAHAVNTREVRVTARRLYENNLVAWRNARDGGSSWATASDLEKPVATRRYQLKAQRNVKEEIRISLDELLGPEQAGDGLYRLEITESRGKDADDDSEDRPWRWGWSNDRTAIVSLSDIGLSAKAAQNECVAWAVSLSTARPMERVRVRLYSTANQLCGQGATDADGLVRIAIGDLPKNETPAVLVAEGEKGTLTWLDLRMGQVSTASMQVGGRAYLRNGHEAFVYADRGLYRPGEKVHLNAIVRGANGSTPRPFPVRWRIIRPDHRDWAEHITLLRDDGGASLALDMPVELPTGKWSVVLGLPQGSNAKAEEFGSATFQLEEFVPDRMKVSVQLGDGATPRVSAVQQLQAQVQADYLFGKPASGLPVRLVQVAKPEAFAPQKWAGWTFGDTANVRGPALSSGTYRHRRTVTGPLTDERGHLKVNVDLAALLSSDADEGEEAEQAADAETKALLPPGPEEFQGPWRIVLRASVSEVGGRAVSGGGEIVVDRLTRYVGVRPRGTSFKPGRSCEFDLALVDPAGNAVTQSGKLEATLLRQTWNTTLVFRDGRYQYDSTRKLEVVSKIKPARIALNEGKGAWSFTVTDAGSYVLRVRDIDAGAETTLSFYASQYEWDDNISRDRPEELELSVAALAAAPSTRPATQPAAPVAADARFRPGGWAEVMIRSPFAGRLLLSIETDRVLSTQVVEMTRSHTRVAIQIPEGCAPNAYVCATVLRPIDPNAKWRVQRAYGVQRIDIDGSSQRLSVAIDSPAELRPQESLGVRLRITDSQGRAVPEASLTLAAVDQGIHQLTDHPVPDPFAYFWADRALGVSLADIYSMLMPEVPRPGAQSNVGGDGGDGSGGIPRISPVQARRVKPVALFSGVVRTDADGVATVNLRLPEFIGQLRLDAVAHQRDRFGSAQATSLVRSPLIVQSSWPRFVAPGDQFVLPLTVFNQTQQAGAAEITITCAEGDRGPLRLPEDGATHKLKTEVIQPGAQGTVRIDLHAAQQIGVGHFEIAATLGGESFRETMEIPVRPASPNVTLTGGGIASADKPLELSLDNGMLPGTRRLTVLVNSYPTVELPRGLDALNRYPYGCAEQTVSSLLPLIYLGDLTQSVLSDPLEQDAIKGKVQSGIWRLRGMLTSSGGVSMWPGYSQEAWPWASVYALHFCAEARHAGHDVPDGLYQPLSNYVAGLVNRTPDAENDTLEVQAYACYALALAGRPDRLAMARLDTLVGQMQAEHCPAASRFHLAAAWLLVGKEDKAAKLIPSKFAPPPQRRSLSGNVGSTVRDQAIILDTLLSVQPDHPQIPMLAQALAEDGRKGRWLSTQDTAFAVMALGKYTRQTRTASRYQSAELLVDGQSAGKSGPQQTLRWKATGSGGGGDPVATKLAVKLTGDAQARGFVSWIDSGTPLKMPDSADAGMSVRRRYLDEQGRPIDLSKLRSGDVVHVELMLSADQALEHVVIEDLLPAGLEIENPRLKHTEEAGVNPPARPRNRGTRTQVVQANLGLPKPGTQPAVVRIVPFHERRMDVRDDRLVLFGDLSGAGTATMVYVCRAVTPGSFIVPPVTAECMYDAGRRSLFGGGAKLTVLDPTHKRAVVDAPTDPVERR